MQTASARTESINKYQMFRCLLAHRTSAGELALLLIRFAIVTRFRDKLSISFTTGMLESTSKAIARVCMTRSLLNLSSKQLKLQIYNIQVDSFEIED